jgi:DNA invertase Pin-like site-specific DNA recombinase
MEGNIRAVLYARVSTADGRQETENQLSQLRELAAREGWSIVKEYVDHDSGGRADRIEFRWLFRDAEQRKFDVILFWALDRFSREGSLETLQYLNQLSKFGVGFRSLSESYLDSCGIFKDAIIALLGAIAKQERLRIGERVHAGLNRARTHGTRSGRPIGRPKAVFHRDTALELRRSGLSWFQIARKLGVGCTTVRDACKGAVVPCGNPGEEIRHA